MDDPFSNRKFLKRHDYASQKGWEFQYERDPIKESKFFNDKKYGSKESSYWNSHQQSRIVTPFSRRQVNWATMIQKHRTRAMNYLFCLPCLPVIHLALLGSIERIATGKVAQIQK